MSAATCGVHAAALGYHSAHPGYSYEAYPAQFPELPRSLHHRLAADEARKLAQPSEQALTGERRAAVGEPQHHAAVIDDHGRFRQHAGCRSGYEIGNAQSRAEDARTIEQPGRDQLAQPRGKLVIDETHMAEEHREREEGA